MEYVLLAVGVVFCAIHAMRAKQLLASAVWLAGVSAFIALIFYVLGAREVAVIELSVGAGLVTVLFVYAIAIAGEEAMNARSLVPKPLAWGLVVLVLALLGVGDWPTLSGSGQAGMEAPFGTVLWEARGLDVLVQVVLIFAGVMGVLGLLAEPERHGSVASGQEQTTDDGRRSEASPMRALIRRVDPDRVQDRSSEGEKIPV
jgi:uncharacterized MnhB-related membrane protein